MFDRERGGAEDHVDQQGDERRFRLGECGDHEEQVQQEVVQAQEQHKYKNVFNVSLIRMSSMLQVKRLILYRHLHN